MIQQIRYATLSIIVTLTNITKTELIWFGSKANLMKIVILT